MKRILRYLLLGLLALVIAFVVAANVANFDQSWKWLKDNVFTF